ncbi:MAG: glycosyltransferase [Candidatus Micrarchaeia archaeon]
METPVWKRYALTFLITAISLAGVIYGSYLVLYVLTSPVEKGLGGIFVVLLAINAAFNIAGCYYYLASFQASRINIPPLRAFPRVAVVVPVRNEKFETVERTLRSLLALDWPKHRLAYYVVDNSDRPDSALARFCRRHGIRYTFIHNPVRLKSYALNKLLPSIKEEFIALFDADDVLINPAFLKENISFLLADPSLASVQTKKGYAPGSLFANTVNAYYSFFYNFVQPVRGADRSGMFCGSVGIVRKSAVEKVGGFPHSPTEDTAFSFLADLQGMGGAFNPRLYALGEPIESFATFLAQQWRYTIGNTRLIWTYLANITRIPLHKQLHYASQVFSFAYLSYLFIFYALLTLAFVLLNLSTTVFFSFKLMPEFAHFIALTYMAAILLMVVAGAKLYFGSYRLGLMVLFMNFSVALTRARAIAVALAGLPTRFVMTRQVPHSMRWTDALAETKWECALAGVLLLFAFLSFIRLDLIGGFWLFWYGWLFSSAPVLAWSTDVRLARKV